MAGRRRPQPGSTGPSQPPPNGSINIYKPSIFILSPHPCPSVLPPCPARRTAPCAALYIRSLYNFPIRGAGPLRRPKDTSPDPRIQNQAAVSAAEGLTLLLFFIKLLILTAREFFTHSLGCRAYISLAAARLKTGYFIGKNFMGLRSNFKLQ